MPEGPEIRLAADRIATVLVGRRVENAFFASPKLRRQRSRVVGAAVTAVDTHGKAMLTRFDSGLTLYSHNQLYGRWYITDPGEEPDTSRSLRVALHTSKGSAWLYSASDIELLSERGLAQHPFLSRIGPDVLDADLGSADIAARLDDARFVRRALSALYLDQSFLAGIGNYLRSEILYCAGIDPTRRPVDLSRAELRRLATETLRISRRSYKTRGITVTRALARQLRAEGYAYRDLRFWVFGREREACWRCGTPITRSSAGSRGLFVCGVCQT
jgi:endonuclease-8